jgi:hypothetical protein
VLVLANRNYLANARVTTRLGLRWVQLVPPEVDNGNYSYKLVPQAANQQTYENFDCNNPRMRIAPSRDSVASMGSVHALHEVSI